MSDQASGYIEHLRQGEQEVRAAQARIDAIVARYQSMSENDLPPLWMMNKIGSHSVEHFRNTGSWSFVELVRRGNVSASSRVIDIGSGCGRLALPFSEIITTGSYFGTDVFAAGITWCVQHIAARNMAFKFFLQDVENNYYFDGEAKPSSSLSMQFADTGTIDFIFAISVFTHLVEADALRYLHEISRCMQPDGVAYITTFILDHRFDSFVARTGMHTAVRLVSDGHFQAYSGQDFFAGYEMQRWQHLVREAGLEIAGFDPGSWAEKPGALHYQDTFILTKARQ